VVRFHYRLSLPQRQPLGTKLSQTKHTPRQRRRYRFFHAPVPLSQITDKALCIPGGKLIFETYNRLGAARIALACASAKQLPVYPARLVTLGGNDMKPAKVGYSPAEFDIRTATGHIGRNGNLSRLTRLGNNLGLLSMVDGVENLVRQVVIAKKFA